MIINHHEIPLLKPCIALIVGILMAEYIPNEIRVSSFFIYFILAFFAWQLLVKKKTSHFTRDLSIVLFFLSVGICSIQERSPKLNSFSYNINASAFCIRIDKVLTHNKHKKCVASILSFRDKDSSFIRSNGEILVYFSNAHSDSSITKGSEFYVTGNLSTMRAASNPHAFDYASYLRHEGIYHQLYVKENKFQYLRKNEKSFLHSRVHLLQTKAKNVIEKYFPDKTNQALVLAMVLGNRDELSQSQSEAFINTGAIHVLAVSGLHVGILCLFLMSIFNLFDKLISIHPIIKGGLVIIFIWCFAMVTGAAPAVCRAALMFTLFYIARDVLRRHVSTYNILFSSAFLILLFDPHQLYKVSFQFSYLAVLSIVFFFPYVNQFVNSKYKIINYFWSSVALGISAQILVFAISIFYFNKFATSFLISSLFVVQLAMIILVSSLLIFMFEALGLWLINEQILSPLTNWVLDIFQQLIINIESLSYSYIENIWIDKIQLLLLYVGLLISMYFIKIKNLTSIPFFLLIIALFLSYSIKSNQSHSKQHKAFLYDSRESFIDVFVGNKTYYYGDSSKEGKAFIYGRNRLAHKIKSSEAISDSMKLNALEFKNQVLRLGDQFIAFANVSLFTEVQSSQGFNFVLVNSTHSDLSEIALDKIEKSEILIDGSVPPWTRKKVIAYCEENELSYYDIKSRGAKVIEF